MSRQVLVAFAAFILCALVLPAAALAATPQSDVASLNQHAQKALAAAQAGDMKTAAAEYKAFDSGWVDVEDGVREASRQSYRNIEAAMRQSSSALDRSSQADAVTALQALVAQDQAFITAAGAPSPSATPTAGSTTMSGLVGELGIARDQAQRQQYGAAAGTMKHVEDGWLDVEGQVKTRSTGDYTATENDMALAATLLSQNSPEALPVIDRLVKRLQPYETQASYGVFDAFIILLREGLEALLVVAALLAFLRRSGNAAKQGWIWIGTGVGLAASIGLAFILNLVFSRAMNPNNRELIEGITGLVAALMLLYVGYWMHSKSSAVAWTKYIKDQTTAALAKGSLFGLAMLSFLAIFREGAETALFYLGIAPSIKTGDLFIGLGLAAVLLVAIGFVMVVAGVRIPVTQFMAVASVLVFFLCFKFLGAGIHSLQVAGSVAATSSAHLPASDFFGVFPTWQTTVPQILLLLLAAGTLVRDRAVQNSPPHSVSSAHAAT